MPHFRVDDAFHSHPKTARAGDEAIGLWVRAGAYCMAYLTDGFVPEWWIASQEGGFEKAQKLVAAGLWRVSKSVTDEYGTAQKGYLFHQWRQDSKAQIEADREKARQRKRQTSGGCGSGELPGIPITHYPEVPNGTPMVGRERGTRIPEDWEPKPHTVERLRQEHPGIDIEYEAKRFKSYWEAESGAKASKKNWNAAFCFWISNEAKWNRGHNNGSARSTVDDKVNGWLNMNLGQRELT